MAVCNGQPWEGGEYAATCGATCGDGIHRAVKTVMMGRVNVMIARQSVSRIDVGMDWFVGMCRLEK